ncbi:hypothetical protein CHU98_g9829, partial [Xylaria longipes]
LMASRFTTSSTAAGGGAGGGGGGGKGGEDLLHVPPEKPKDPAEEAAKLGMYGAMTRSVRDFYPTRLLCKRFNVRPPAHLQPDAETETGGGKASGMSTGMGMGAGEGNAVTLDELMRQAQAAASNGHANSDSNNIDNTNRNSGAGNNQGLLEDAAKRQAPVEVKPDVNEALEGNRAQDQVLKAIFGDSSDEED